MAHGIRLHHLLLDHGPVRGRAGGQRAPPPARRRGAHALERIDGGLRGRARLRLAPDPAHVHRRRRVGPDAGFAVDAVGSFPRNQDGIRLGGLLHGRSGRRRGEHARRRIPGAPRRLARLLLSPRRRRRGARRDHAAREGDTPAAPRGFERRQRARTLSRDRSHASRRPVGLAGTRRHPTSCGSCRSAASTGPRSCGSPDGSA
jgi:hypothetical protein